MSALGPLVFFAQFLRAGGRFDALCGDAPLEYRSGNAPAVRDVVGTLLLGILAGHWRYAHLTALRFDEVAPALLGLSRIVSGQRRQRASRGAPAGPNRGGAPGCNGVCRAATKSCSRACGGLDIDMTIKPLYGRQQGATLGYNPQKTPSTS